MKTRNRIPSLLALAFACCHPCAFADVQITVQGVDGELLNNVQEGLTLNVRKENELSSDQINVLYQRGFEEIKLALQPFGYYHPNVQGKITTTSSSTQVRYTIQLGRPTLVDDVALSYQPPFDAQAFNEWAKAFPLKQGDRLRHEPYEDAKSELLAIAYERGYIEAIFETSQILVDLEQFMADIVLRLAPGPQYQFGQITFGESFYDESFLRRFVPDATNRPFRAATLSEFERRMIQSDLFSKVNFEPQPPQGNEVPIKASLEDARANRYLIGVGYDTNTQFRVRLGWNRKKFNRFGHTFDAKLKISELDTIIDAAYTIPGAKPWVDNYQISANYSDEEYVDKPSERFSGQISQTKEVGSWVRTIGLRYLNEHFSDSNNVSESSQFLMPEIAFKKVEVNDTANPTQGYQIEAKVMAGFDGFLSDETFVQLYGMGKRIWPLSPSTTLLAKGELGAIIPNDYENLPLSLRFYAGGLNSLRGFDYRALPIEVDDDGLLRPVGGAYLILGTLELSQHLFETRFGQIQGALFTDGGSAVREINDDLELSFGAGLRWLTPLGPLKVDVAKALTQSSEGYRVHVSFGPEFG